jgi:tetratricopeptide (TPR) repeat protein
MEAGESGPEEKLRAACESLEHAVAQNPEYPCIYNNLGEARRGLKEYGKAAEAYRKACELNRHDADAAFSYAMTLQEGGVAGLLEHDSEEVSRSACATGRLCERLCDLAGRRGGSGGLPPTTPSLARFRRQGHSFVPPVTRFRTC